jgi:hypothetical protein
MYMYYTNQVQVWEQTPGYGGEPFLDTLWSAIDEVSFLHCIRCGSFLLISCVLR